MPLISVEELNEIVKLANSVPTEYRQKCFELLLSRALQLSARISNPAPGPANPSPLPPVMIDSLNLPIDVKAFFNQYHLDLTILPSFFHIEGTEVRPIYTLHDTTKVKAQTNLALLMSLEAAIRTGSFQVEIESLRTRCQEQKCYDMANFMRHIKNHSRLFKTIASDQPLTLSIEGKAQLADLLKHLAS